MTCYLECQINLTYSTVFTKSASANSPFKLEQTSNVMESCFLSIIREICDG